MKRPFKNFLILLLAAILLLPCFSHAHAEEMLGILPESQPDTPILEDPSSPLPELLPQTESGEPSVGPESPPEEPEDSFQTPDTSMIDHIVLETEKQAIYNDYFSESRPVLEEYRGASDLSVVAVNGEMVAFTPNGRATLATGVKEAFRVDGGVIYLTEDNRIMRSDATISSQQLLYQGNGTITHLHANSELAYFSENNTVYRYHMETGMVDAMFTAPVNITYIKSVTNQSVLWGERNPAYDAYEAQYGLGSGLDSGIQPSILYLYDTATNQSQTVDYLDIFPVVSSPNAAPPMQPAGASSSLPLSNYLSMTSWFNRSYRDDNGDVQFWPLNGSADDPHPEIPGVQACDPSHIGGTVTDCREYKLSHQCVAFAKYVYDQMYPATPWSTDDEHEFPYGSGLPNYATFSQIPDGSYILLANNPAATGTTHSAILVSKNADGFICYEANLGSVGGDCQVRFSFIYYSDLSFNYVIKYITPHTHSFTYSLSPNGGHTKTCSSCGYSFTEAHSFVYNRVDEIGHWIDCSDSSCPYQKTLQSHTFSRIPFGTGNTLYHTQHRKKCILCSEEVTEAHTMKYVLDNISSHRQKCDGCDYQTAPMDHNYGAWVSAGNSQHSRVCAACHQTQLANHSYGGWSFSGSSHSRTCASCGRAENHNMGAWTKKSESGHIRTCSDGCTDKSETAAHGSWQYGQWYNRSLSSACKYRSVTCGICSYSYTEYDTAHSYGSWQNDASAGVCRRTCTKCGYSYTQAHSYGNWSSTGASQHARSCASCGAKQTGNHNALTHGPWTAVSTAGVCRRQYLYCSICGAGKGTNQDTVHRYSPSTSKKCADCSYRRP